MNTQGNDMSIDSDFKRGSKTSSSLIEGEVTPLEVQRFMETSFYLPVDILKNSDWYVSPITVVSGARFKELVDANNHSYFHFVEDKELLFKAQFVAISTRRKNYTRRTFHVCKIWYGAAPK